MYVNLFYVVVIIYFLLMNRLSISLGEQNFPAVEELNNAEITNYVMIIIIIILQYVHFGCRNLLTPREN